MGEVTLGVTGVSSGSPSPVIAVRGAGEVTRGVRAVRGVSSGPPGVLWRPRGRLEATTGKPTHQHLNVLIRPIRFYIKGK